MKRSLLFCVLLFLSLSLAFGTLSYLPLTENPPAPEDGTPENGTGEDTPQGGTPAPTPEAPIYTELGIPTAEKYPQGDPARCPWDMVIYEGKLYFGSGDYVKNKGPAEVFCYDPETGVTVKSGTLPDEEVSRFCLLNGRLAVPGTDPTDPWSTDAPFFGGYYLLENGAWVQKQVLPGAIHNFDLLAYGDLIFAGMGVIPASFPIAVSEDGGESFSPVPMYKGDTLLDTADFELVRTHDLLLCGDTLYATFYANYPDKTRGSVYELYAYDESDACFRFVASLDGTVERLAYSHALIGEAVTFDGRLFFATGYLYATKDMTVFERTVFPDLKIVADLAVSGETLYLLGAAKDKESGLFRTAVYALETGRVNPTLVFDFLYDVPAMSLAVSGNTFYIGMGDGNTAHAKNGTVLQVTHPDAS